MLIISLHLSPSLLPTFSREMNTGEAASEGEAAEINGGGVEGGLYRQKRGMRDGKHSFVGLNM